MLCRFLPPDDWWLNQPTPPSSTCFASRSLFVMVSMALAYYFIDLFTAVRIPHNLFGQERDGDVWRVRGTGVNSPMRMVGTAKVG